MKTQMQWSKKDETSSETINERDRQVMEAIDQFIKATIENGDAESYLPEVWKLAADLLRIEMIYKLKTEEMAPIS